MIGQRELAKTHSNGLGKGKTVTFELTAGRRPISTQEVVLYPVGREERMKTAQAPEALRRRQATRL